MMTIFSATPPWWNFYPKDPPWWSFSVGPTMKKFILRTHHDVCSFFHEDPPWWNLFSWRGGPSMMKLFPSGPSPMFSLAGPPWWNLSDGHPLKKPPPLLCITQWRWQSAWLVMAVPQYWGNSWISNISNVFFNICKKFHVFTQFRPQQRFRRVSSRVFLDDFKQDGMGWGLRHYNYSTFKHKRHWFSEGWHGEKYSIYPIQTSLPN